MVINRRAPRECDARHLQNSNTPIAMGTTMSHGPKTDKTVDPMGDKNGIP
jgi:hypothetical protein